jgi:hypothetical protein
MRTRHDQTQQNLAALTGLLQDLTGDMPPAHRQRLKDHLTAEFRRAEPSRSPAPGRPRLTGPRGRQHRRARLILGATAAVAGVATAVAVIGIMVLGGPTLPPPAKGAVQLLAKVADAAARQPTPRVRDSQYMYVEIKVAILFSPRQLQTMKPIKHGSFPRHLHLKKPITSQVWAPVADVCRLGLERGNLRPNGPWTSSTFTARGPGVKCPSIGSLNDPTYRLLQTLPTDPHTLLAQIYRVERGHGPSADQEAFVTISDLLRSTIPPPKVAAALYRAAALIPGVTLIPHATDAIGRHGVAVAQTAGIIRDELIFSKTTLRLIGERTIMTSTGEVTSATAIVAQAFADHLGLVPPSTQSPIS